MTTAWAPPSKVGDRHPDIIKAKNVVDNYKYGAAVKAERPQSGYTDEYTSAFGAALIGYATAVNADIRAGRNNRRPPYVNTDGVLDWAMKIQMEIIPRTGAPALPKPAGPRHAALVWRGTGGVIGQDYVSRVCQGAGDLVEEINPDFPASMGGLPPGAPGTPSARIAIQIGYRSGVAWIKANPHRTFVLGGYSLGEIVVAMLLDALFTPGGELYEHRDRFVCSFHIGPPARPLGAAFFNGTPAPGVGISSWRLPHAVLTEVGARACYLCHPDDMYGAIPVPIPGGTGDIMETVFDMVTDAGMSDFIGTVTRMIPHLLEIASDAGVLGAVGMGGVGQMDPNNPLSMIGALPALLGGGALLLNPITIVPMLLPLFIAAMPGLIAGIGGGVGGNLTGPAAAAQAAIIAMKFLMTGTAPHINYHAWEVWPGQTYLGLAIQHTRDWASRTPIRN